MIQLAIAFAVCAGYTFLKAIQQLNVQRDARKLILPTSLLLSAGDVWVVAYVAVKGFNVPTVLSLGCGAASGTLIAMWLHQKFFKGQ